jgi:uncharacterized membrane protein YqjE
VKSEDSPSFGRAPAGLFESMRALLATLVAMVQARTELLGVELEEEGVRLVTMLVGAMIVVVLGGLALLFAGLIVVAAFWDTHRVAAVVSVAAGFALANASGCARGVGCASSRRRLACSRRIVSGCAGTRRDDPGTVGGAARDARRQVRHAASRPGIRRAGAATGRSGTRYRRLGREQNQVASAHRDDALGCGHRRGPAASPAEPAAVGGYRQSVGGPSVTRMV